MEIISEISCIVHAQCPFWCLNNHRNQTQSQQTLQPTDSKMFSARIRPQLTIAQTWYAAVTPSASWITSVEWKQSCNFHNWLGEGGNRLGVITAYSKMFKTLESLELETHFVSFLKTDPQNSTQFSTCWIECCQHWRPTPESKGVTFSKRLGPYYRCRHVCDSGKYAEWMFSEQLHGYHPHWGLRGLTHSLQVHAGILR